MELNFLGDLDVLNYSLSQVVSKGGAVNVESNGVGGCIDNLDWLSLVYLGHALHFAQNYVVSFLVDVSFVFVQSHFRLCSLLN